MGDARWSRWLDSWCIAALPVAAFTLAWRGLADALSCMLLAGLVVVMTRMALLDPDLDSIRQKTRGAPSSALRMAVIVLGVMGLFWLQPGLGLLTFVALIATSPPTAAKLTARSRSHLTTLRWTDAVAVTVMSDAALCAEWKSSHRTVRELLGTDPGRLEAITARRRDVLEELLRRHPSEVTSWLKAGPHPAAGPDTYLPDGPPEMPASTD